MKIFYGTDDHKIDVTVKLITNNGIINSPWRDDNRAYLFTDPVPGILKKIYIHDKSYEDKYTIKIENGVITTVDYNDIVNKWNNIKSNLKLLHGSFDNEVPEQLMVVRYLTGNEKVLEIGSNIGRNSMIIASITNNLVTLECNYNVFKKLEENKKANGLSFFI